MALLHPTPRIRHVAPLLAALSACAGDPAAAPPAAPLRAEQAAAAEASEKTLDADAMQALSDAEGTFFAAVRAEGSGCPEGTLNTRVSPDGKAFTTTFTSYEARIDAGTETMTRNCRFAILLDAPGGRSFCVKQFGYSGNAFLQAGVSGSQTADYYFNEQKLSTESARSELVGPYDADFVFTDTVSVDEEIWSPCEEQRDLFVDTSLALSNGDPRGAGFINVAAADGTSTIELRLASHRCDMGRNAGWTVGPFAARTDTLAASATTRVTQSGGGSIGRTIR
ncbi:MAG: DUF4360 domain-containing protein [Polyangiales bacterium]